MLCSHWKSNVLRVCRLLRKKLLWQSWRRRKLNSESRLGRKRKLPKRLKKPGLGTNAKQMMMTRVNGDKRKKVTKINSNFRPFAAGLLVVSLLLEAGEEVALLVSSQSCCVCSGSLSPGKSLLWE